MDADELKRYICSTFDGLWVIADSGDTFFLYDPERDLPPARQTPFATIVTGDRHDTASQLDRPGAWRVNIGLTRATYEASFGAAPSGERDAEGVLRTGYDHTVADTLMPHPVYASHHWVCVVNPGDATRETILTLLAEAHAFAARKYARYKDRHRGRKGVG